MDTPILYTTFMLRSLLIICALLTVGCAQQPSLYPKHVVFPEGATEEQKIDMVSRLVPTPQQLEWQQMELSAFLHFGINTFTGNEWGNGSDDPVLFNPTELDCEQWVRTLAECGFKMAILTAKHHDGFCLWPTATTNYSVKSSPWREGNGDVVKELRDACDKYGLKFGVYLSPWDRNAKCYGDSPAYNKLFIAQLTELLTNYGKVDEVWFDGACAEGANGKVQVYDWEAILQTIRQLQPTAVTAIMGDDVRWVGNEGGIGRSTEWSATAITPKCYTDKVANNEALGLGEMSKDLGSRELIARATEAYWYPSEVDVSIRPGWFYRSSEDNRVRPVSNLVDIYFYSVGRNSVLLLNIPPDKRGLIHETDCQHLKEFSTYIKETFCNNLIDDSSNSCTIEEGSSKIYDVVPNSVVNTLLLQEDITLGQHVEEFVVEGFYNDSWHYITEGTTIGYKRLLRFSACMPEKLRITIRSSRGPAHLLNSGLYYSTPLENGVTSYHFSDVDTSTWQAVGLEATEAFDNDRNSVWRSEGLTPLVVDMGEEYTIAGFCYTPASEALEGTIFNYQFYVSTDSKEWVLCNTNGEFCNIMHNPIPYVVRFGKSYYARYFKLVPLREIEEREMTSVAEIGILLE